MIRTLVLGLALVLAVAAGYRAPSPAGADRQVAAARGFDPRMTAVCERACSFGGEYADADLAPQPGVEHGQLTRCVVSGVVFVVRDETPFAAHAGERYAFCCGTCGGLFAQDPERFARAGRKT